MAVASRWISKEDFSVTACDPLPAHINITIANSRLCHHTAAMCPIEQYPHATDAMAQTHAEIANPHQKRQQLDVHHRGIGHAADSPLGQRWEDGYEAMAQADAGVTK
jgi:hypothetical protein